VFISVSSPKQKVDGLEAQIAELWQTKTTLKEAIVDFPHRKEEQLRICSLETEIASGSAEISAKVEARVWLLGHGRPDMQEQSKAGLTGKPSLGKIPIQSLPSLL
jgi:hypothetical protein